MKFYNRNAEIVQLQSLSGMAYNGRSTMTLLVGRRRIGKTELLKQCFKSDPNFLYFFISRKNDELLCEEYIEDIANKFDIPSWAKINKFIGFFEFILQQSINRPLTVVFDEFQDIKYIDESIFTSMQNLWDKYKNKCKIHLIVCGSIYSIMCKLFENSKEPLFGRADTKINLKPLKISTLQEILIDEQQYSPQNLLTLYTIIGGVPRYLDLLHMHKAWNLEAMLHCILQDNSFFINEGKDVLIEELGKEYKVYFSILSLIARGKSSRSAIESVLQISTGGYIERLDSEYAIIKKIKPIFAKENSRTQKYYIQDNFLNFWFRYIYRHQSAIEIGNYNYVIDVISSDFTTYSGKFLEFMIRELLANSGNYNNVGTYWERDNNNEIDIIACNDKEKILLLADVKLQAKKLNLELLQHKSRAIIDAHRNYEITFHGYSLDDVDSLINKD